MARRGDRQVNIPGLEAGIEIREQRGRNNVSFRLPDGTEKTIISPDLHFHNGEDWVEYDHRFLETPQAFIIRAAVYNARINKENAAIILAKDDKYLRLVPVSLNGVAADPRFLIHLPGNEDALVREDRILASGVFGSGTSLIYKANERRFTKWLRIMEPMEQCNLLWRIHTDLRRKGTRFFNGDNLWGKLGQPVAIDSIGQICIGEYHFTENGVRVTFNPEWMQSATYPVFIDPDTIYGETADKYITGQNATYSTARATSTAEDSTSPAMIVGQAFNGGQYYVYRGYYEFDTSSVTNEYDITDCTFTSTIWIDSSATDFDALLRFLDWGSSREDDFDDALTAEDIVTWLNTSGKSTDTPYSCTVPAKYINKVGDTKLCMISSRDRDATTPTGYENLILYPQEAATQAYRPYLTITKVLITKDKVRHNVERDPVTGLEYWWFNWKADHNGSVSFPLGIGHRSGPVGIIDRFESSSEDADSGYDVYLYDEETGADLLQSKGENCSNTSVDIEPVAQQLGEGTSIPVPTGGIVKFTVENAGANSRGTSVLVIRPS